jgi:hypothetical protein
MRGAEDKMLQVGGSGDRPGPAGATLEQGSGRVRPRAAWQALACVLCVAALLRVWNYPSPAEVRDCDEIGYLTTGLQLWEGIIPGYKHTPDGPQTWWVWMYAASRSVASWFSSDSEDLEGSWKLRPFLEIDRALFESYADLTTLHRIVLLIQFLVSLGAFMRDSGSAFRAGASAPQS